MIRTAAATACARHATVSHCRSPAPSRRIIPQLCPAPRHRPRRRRADQSSRPHDHLRRPTIGTSRLGPKPENSMVVGPPTPPPAFSPTRFVRRLRATQTCSSFWGRTSRESEGVMRPMKPGNAGGSGLILGRFFLVGHSLVRPATRTFFRPDRTHRAPSWEAAVKDGRHAILDAGSGL